MTPHLILIHKQSTSGRVRFLRFPHGVVGLAPLPAGTTVREDALPTVCAHPAAALQEVSAHLGIPVTNMASEAEFQAWVDSPDGPRQVMLAAFTTIDPPFDAAAAHDCKFIAMTEARGLPATELALMRKVYEYVLG
ncbi:MAG: hypothetical protein EG825_10720 [Rhodocyclaceae bacterium]|nr:hypothetical protein [Rhodocyclaceae bacterium]